MPGWVALAEIEAVQVAEHLPGRHNQKSHGNWARKPGFSRGSRRSRSGGRSGSRSGGGSNGGGGSGGGSNGGGGAQPTTPPEIGSRVQAPDGTPGRLAAVVGDQAFIIHDDGSARMVPLKDLAPEGAEPTRRIKTKPYEGKASPKHTRVEDWFDKGDLIGDERGDGPGDSRLGNIWREQGFDGPPKAVSDEELDKEIEGGAIELFRGLHGPKALEYAEQFIGGDEHFPGLGVYGNGTYTTPSSNFASRYASRGGVLLRMALPKDARIIDAPELFNLSQQAKNDLQGNPGVDPRVRDAMSDPGRLASMLGYDAIRVPTTPTEYIILNRTAVSVSTRVRDVYW